MWNNEKEKELQRLQKEKRQSEIDKIINFIIEGRKCGKITYAISRTEVNCEGKPYTSISIDIDARWI